MRSEIPRVYSMSFAKTMSDRLVLPYLTEGDLDELTLARDHWRIKRKLIELRKRWPRIARAVVIAAIRAHGTVAAWERHLGYAPLEMWKVLKLMGLTDVPWRIRQEDVLLRKWRFRPVDVRQMIQRALRDGPRHGGRGERPTHRGAP